MAIYAIDVCEPGRWKKRWDTLGIHSDRIFTSEEAANMISRICGGPHMLIMHTSCATVNLVKQSALLKRNIFPSARGNGWSSCPQ